MAMDSRRIRPEQSEQTSGRMRQYYDETTETVARHPAQSVLIMFGVGCLGLLLGHALAEPPHEERSPIARFGKSVLDALASLPESVSQRVAKLNLPESIAQRLGR
jgi:hypothetical protein